MSYIISWTKPTRHCGRWLHMTEEGGVLLVHHREKATSFSRDQANDILLALYNAGRWSEVGKRSWPQLDEVR